MVVVMAVLVGAGVWVAVRLESGLDVAARPARDPVRGRACRSGAGHRVAGRSCQVRGAMTIGSRDAVAGARRTASKRSVELNDHELVISGEVAEPKEGRRRRRSRRTGRFEFRASLPGDINPEGVTASLSDGVLTVRVPKAEAAKPHRVEITG